MTEPEKPEAPRRQSSGAAWASAFEVLAVVAGIVAIVYINVRW